MTDPSSCPHEDTEPVEVRDHTNGGTRTVAQICRDCLTQLHAGWGCPRCTWNSYETRTLSEQHATTHHVLERPCLEHA